MLSTLLLVYLTSHYLALTSAQNNTTSSSPSPSSCTQGYCAHEVPATKDSMYGKMEIFGDENAISDITSNAGWKIVKCDPNAPTQNITIMCTNNNNGSCDHVLKEGAEGKIVYIGNECGSVRGPFAHVAKYWGVSNQTSPVNGTSSINGTSSVNATTGLDGSSQSQLHTLLMTTNFTHAASYNNSKGPVTFAIKGYPGLATGGNTSEVRASSGNSSTPTRRDSSGYFSYDKNEESSTIPLNFAESLTLYQNNMTCDGVFAQISLSGFATTAVDADVGLDAVGTVVPPKFNTFQIYVGAAGTLDIGLRLKADIQDSITLSNEPVFEVGLPGLSFGSVLNIGPTFKILATVEAEIDVQADLSLESKQELATLVAYIPPNGQDNFIQFYNTSVPMGVSLGPQASLSLTSEIKLAPTLDFGIDAFDNEASVDVYIDISGNMKLTISGDVGATVSTDSATASGNACVDLVGTVASTVGVSGDFFDFLSDGASIDLFSESWTMFQECLNPSASSKRSRRSQVDERLAKRGASCFSSPANLVPVVQNGTATASH